ncbi:MAG: FAD-dependent oxidoreductase [Bacteroidota bacterium]|nr:FAD-dependent oxidoreductase [Bacteroidota bacterium]
MKQSVIIIGGGIAGMEAAASLARMGIEVTIVEKENALGGHLLQWDRLFPDRKRSDEVLEYLKKEMDSSISVETGCSVKEISRENGNFRIILDNEKILNGNALLLATGYDLFNARKKEEYGYGIYENVITSAELEGFLRKNPQPGLMKGFQVKRIGIIHCVGSRDEKVGNLYCSKLCCITAVKQAIEIREILPDVEVFCFYMDLRMFDRHFEEMYYEAQKKWGVHFIRGRLSEADENPDHTLILKVEDTLTGLPLKMTVDALILMVGMTPSAGTKKLADMAGALSGEDGFLMPSDEHLQPNETTVPGLFLTGAVKGPVSVGNTLADARAAALKIYEYFSRMAG